MALATLARSEEEPIDYSEDELELKEEEPLIDKRTKRKKTTMVHASPLKLRRPPLPTMAYNQPTLLGYLETICHCNSLPTVLGP